MTAENMTIQKIIFYLQRCADMFSGMNLKNDDGTYTLITSVLYQAIEKLEATLP